MKKNEMEIVFFMPSIESGGVEKNLFIIGNFIAKNTKYTKIITADSKYNNYFRNMEVISPKINFSNSQGRKLKYIFCLVELFKLILKNKKILVFSFQANLYCIVLCKIFFDIKVIVRANSSSTGWSKSPIKKFIFKKILKLADKIIVNSIDFKKEFKRDFNIDTKCIYNPLDREKIIKLSKEKIKFPFFQKYKKILKIVNVGRLVDQKDQLTLLRALKIIKNKVPFKALFIGTGKNRTNMQNFIDENNLKKDVKILPFKKNPFSYINLADTLILSSIYEGLPNVLLEALVLKKFIISSDCPTGPREILSNGKGGMLFKPKDYSHLAKKISFYFYNKKKLLTNIKYANKKLNRFDSEINLNKYLHLVRKESNK